MLSEGEFKERLQLANEILDQQSRDVIDLMKEVKP